MSLVHLGYDKANHRDYVYSVDENGDKQFEFDELYHATYNAPLPEDSPRYLAYYELPGGSKTFVKGDFIKESANSNVVQLSREKGFPAYDVPKENVFEYTGVLDINGNPIYEWDYVKIDELGWTGFAFKREKDENFGPGICIEGTGGFSSDPCKIEILASPFVVKEFPDSEHNEELYKLNASILEFEKDFIEKRRDAKPLKDYQHE